MNTVPKLYLLVDRELNDGRFVIVNTSKIDVPVGSVFTDVQSKLAIREGNSFREEALAPPDRVTLEIIDAEFFRHQVNEVPYGHNAAVRMKGEGIEKLQQHLAARKKSVFVFLSSGEAAA